MHKSVTGGSSFNGAKAIWLNRLWVEAETWCRERLGEAAGESAALIAVETGYTEDARTVG